MPPPVELYATAAELLRRQDCPGALAEVARLAADPAPGAPPSETPSGHLLTGLYAHACADVDLAEQALGRGSIPGGALEDWRLYLLADSAAARGHTGRAREALETFLAEHGESPLRPRVLLRLATLAWEEGDADASRAWINRAHDLEIDVDSRVRLDLLAWEIAVRRDEREARRAAGRRLLVHAPGEAARLRVIEEFRAPGGELDWTAILSPEDLLRRARSLLDLGLPDSALDTLRQIPLPHRSPEQRLLEARALTAAHRGREALALLDGTSPTDPAAAARVAWQRAEAAADLATFRRGAANLPSAARQHYRQRCRQHLEQVARLDADPELTLRALRRLFPMLVEEDRFDASIAVLRRLRQLDAGDTTGAAHLWERGWQAYDRGNYTGAVGYWSELEDLYPGSPWARSGRYWTGRAFDTLGEAARAEEIYREVAASDTTDFYRKHALARLDGKPPNPAGEEIEPTPWPRDGRLERAWLLSDLGLDTLAETELELRRDAAETAAAAALRGLVLARRGERRESIPFLRRAFPALGSPHQAGVPEQARRLYYPLDFVDIIRKYAGQQRLPIHLVLGMVRQESAFDVGARSWAGARGLMQIMPATGRELARKMGIPYGSRTLVEPETNLRLGMAYFRQVLDMFDGNVELALAGYNGGPYRIRRLWGRSGGSELDAFLEGLTIEESKTYVKRILLLSDSYRQLYPTI